MMIRLFRSGTMGMLLCMAMLVCITSGSMAQGLTTAPEPVTVVPYPRDVILEKGSYAVRGTEVSLRFSGLEGNTVEIMREQLMEAYRERFGIILVEEDSKAPGIWIGIPSRDEALRELALKKGMMPGGELGREGYLLKIENKEIIIVANDAPGVFYGVQSLRQIFRGNPDPLQVKAMSIRDWPSMDFRCIMDDISRGPIPTMDYMKLQVRRYAEMKMNNMSFYIEHVVQTEKYPDMAPAEGGISVEEFRELSEYAADYHIELVGNFQSLGHFEKILSLPQFRHLGATERMLNPLDPEALAFLDDIYREMAPAFSSPYFTPNLDEAWDLSRGGLKGAAGELGPARIYADHVTKVDAMLRSAGKQSFIWGDIILEHPEILEMIPPHIIMGAWNYSPSESFAEYIDPLTSAGFKFMVAPGVLNSNRLIPDFNMSTTNIRNFINEGYEKGAMGVYCTVWDDGGLHFFSHDWYGLAYNAEQSWRPNRESLEDFDLRFSRAIYGDQQQVIPTALHTLNKLSLLEPTFEMNSNVFYKALVPGRGDRVTFDPGSWIEVKLWTDKAGEILEGAKFSRFSGDVDFIRFTIDQYAFMADSRRQLIAAATAYQLACELQRNDRKAALAELEIALGLLRVLGERMDQLAAGFLELWDRESRTHWRERAVLDFGKHQEAFADQAALLEQAINAFREGRFLPPPTELRMDIRQQEGQYFQYWLLCGSFHIASFDEYPPDFLGPIGGEAAARPFPGMTFTDTTGVERMWIKHDSPKMGEVDFLTIFDPRITAVAYAYCVIESSEPQLVTALLGSNDGATVWCNGKEVHHVHGKRSLIPDEDEFTLDLEAGKNHIMIKVEQWKADWGLSFRLKDVEIRNHKQKYYIQ